MSLLSSVPYCFNARRLGNAGSVQKTSLKLHNVVLKTGTLYMAVRQSDVHK